PPYMETYKRSGLWLRAHTPPDTTVAYYEVGALGYFSDRRVLDLFGIVSPELLPDVRRGDFSTALLDHPPDYALYHTGRGGWRRVDRLLFKAAFTCVERIPEGQEELQILKRRADVPLPGASRTAAR